MSTWSKPFLKSFKPFRSFQIFWLKTDSKIWNVKLPGCRKISSKPFETHKKPFKTNKKPIKIVWNLINAKIFVARKEPYDEIAVDPFHNRRAESPNRRSLGQSATKVRRIGLKFEQLFQKKLTYMWTTSKRKGRCKHVRPRMKKFWAKSGRASSEKKSL